MNNISMSDLEDRQFFVTISSMPTVPKLDGSQRDVKAKMARPRQRSIKSSARGDSMLDEGMARGCRASASSVVFESSVWASVVTEILVSLCGSFLFGLRPAPFPSHNFLDSHAWTAISAKKHTKTHFETVPESVFRPKHQLILRGF